MMRKFAGVLLLGLLLGGLTSAVRGQIVIPPSGGGGGGGFDPTADITFTGTDVFTGHPTTFASVTAASLPSTTGFVRLAKDTVIASRNSGNSGDVDLIGYQSHPLSDVYAAGVALGNLTSGIAFLPPSTLLSPGGDGLIVVLPDKSNYATALQYSDGGGGVVSLNIGVGISNLNVGSNTPTHSGVTLIGQGLTDTGANQTWFGDATHPLFVVSGGATVYNGTTHVFTASDFVGDIFGHDSNPVSALGYWSFLSDFGTTIAFLDLPSLVTPGSSSTVMQTSLETPGDVVIFGTGWPMVNVSSVEIFGPYYDPTFPALKGNGTVLEVRTGNDSAYAPLKVGALQLALNNVFLLGIDSGATVVPLIGVGSDDFVHLADGSHLLQFDTPNVTQIFSTAFTVTSSVTNSGAGGAALALAGAASAGNTTFTTGLDPAYAEAYFDSPTGFRFLESVVATDFKVGSASIVPLTGTTGSIGGGLLAGAGSCATGTATVTGATPGQPVAASTSDGTAVSGLVAVYASVTASNTVTVQECAIAAVTPTAKTYNVAVLPKP